MANLLDEFFTQRVAAQTAAGTTTINSAIVDMAQADDALFLLTLDTPNAANFVKLQDGALSDGSDMTDLAGSKVIPTGAGPASILLAFSRLGTAKRYVRAVVVRGVSTRVGEIYAQVATKRKPQASVDNNVHFGKQVTVVLEGTP